jgi:hypothetical protein
MRSCPHCHAVFGDDMSFCLEDGTPLAEPHEYQQATESYSAQEHPAHCRSLNRSSAQELKSRTSANCSFCVRYTFRHRRLDRWMVFIGSREISSFVREFEYRISKRKHADRSCKYVDHD